MGGESIEQMRFLIEIYTGREFEVLPQELIYNLDMIVCGPYRQDLAMQGFPASGNQKYLKKVGGSWIYQNCQ